MLCIPLGRINVPTAGVPVSLPVITSFSYSPPSGQVAKIEVWPDPASAGKVYVKSGGTILAALPVAASGAVYPWSTPELDDNGLTPSQFSIDAATSGDGAFVTLWIK